MVSAWKRKAAMDSTRNSMLHSTRGPITILRKIIITFANQQPAALAHAMTNPKRLREACVNSQQPDALIAGMAGMAADLQFFATRRVAT
jgi:chorismate-pyruvate lyase